VRRRGSHIFYTTGSQMAVRLSKAIPVADRGDPEGCETLRLPHFLYNRLTDGGEVVSLTRRPPFTLIKISVTHFFKRLSRSQSHSAAGRTSAIEKSSYLFGNRYRDLTVCIIVPQPSTLPRAPPPLKHMGIHNLYRLHSGSLHKLGYVFRPSQCHHRDVFYVYLLTYVRS
jgi:hypothetical protein